VSLLREPHIGSATTLAVGSLVALVLGTSTSPDEALRFLEYWTPPENASPKLTKPGYDGLSSE
jgi:hypothetical protein